MRQAGLGGREVGQVEEVGHHQVARPRRVPNVVVEDGRVHAAVAVARVAVGGPSGVQPVSHPLEKVLH